MGDAVGLSGSLIHQLTPFLHERLEFAGRFGIRLQGPPPAAIKRQQIQQEVRIARIILAAGRIHGLAVIGTGGGVHGVQRQMLVFAQGVQKRATRLLHRDGRARSGEPFGPLQGPGLASGACLRVPCWRCGWPGSWTTQACSRSAQSMAIHAAKSGSCAGSGLDPVLLPSLISLSLSGEPLGPLRSAYSSV